MTDAVTLAGLDAATLADVLRVANRADFDRWQDQIRRTGGCSDPIRLIGGTKTIDPATKTVLHAYSTDTEPGGMLRIACGNRRASRCPACAWTYAGDTYHLIRAGLVGDPDKGTPHTIRDHPRVFATLTAPSFGPVHNRPGNRPCRCGIRHPEGAPELGTPLDPESYDYAGAVLWNNYASDLWRYFTIYLRREIARRAGLTQKAAREQSRVSFGKVAEYQKRGAVHFHAVIRFDRPGGPDDPPPAWATLDLLTDAIRAAADRVTVDVPRPDTSRTRSNRRSHNRPEPCAGAPNSTSSPSAPSATARRSPKLPWPLTSPSTPPRPLRRPAPWTAGSATKRPWSCSTCPITPPG